jgi:hypothetical protein
LYVALCWWLRSMSMFGLFSTFHFHSLYEEKPPHREPLPLPLPMFPVLLVGGWSGKSATAPSCYNIQTNIFSKRAHKHNKYYNSMLLWRPLSFTILKWVLKRDYDNLGCTRLAQDTVQCCAFVNTAMNLRGPEKSWHFWLSYCYCVPWRKSAFAMQNSICSEHDSSRPVSTTSY